MKNHSIERLACGILLAYMILASEMLPSFLTAEALAQKNAETEETGDVSVVAQADSDSVNAGAAVILDMNIALNQDAIHELIKNNTVDVTETPEEPLPKEPTGSLVMAHVNQYCSMRKTPESTGEVLGRLYNFCGGTVLEYGDGWTKVRSGDVIGWVDNRYLYFGDEALEFASNISTEIVVSDVNGLRVHAEADLSSEAIGVLSKNENLTYVADNGDFTMVEYGDGVAYVQSDYVHHDMEIAQAEDIETITFRESQELYARLNKDREPYDATAEEIDLLAALVQKEAGGESYEGKIAVANVVINRVRSVKFPNSIHEVVYAKNQFTPATNGSVDKLLAAGGANEDCYEAVNAALSGRWTIGDYLYFRRKGNKSGYILGNHVFY